MMKGITHVLQESYFRFLGKVGAVYSDTADLTKSKVVAGGGRFSASHYIGFGGFSSFFLGAGFLAAAFLPSLPSFFFSLGISLPNVTLIGSSFFKKGLGLACTIGIPGIMGRS